MQVLILLIVGAIFGHFTRGVHASVTEFQKKADWLPHAGPFTSINFTGFPNNTLITTQYSALGVVFTDNSDYIHFSNSFPNDGRGLNGAFDEIAVTFSQPISTIAVDFPGFVQFKLYYLGRLIYTSSLITQGGAGNFAGLISTDPFDRAIIQDPGGGVFIDDLFFGPPIPAPGALVLVGLALLIPRRRRRTI